LARLSPEAAQKKGRNRIKNYKDKFSTRTIRICDQLWKDFNSTVVKMPHGTKAKRMKVEELETIRKQMIIGAKDRITIASLWKEMMPHFMPKISAIGIEQLNPQVEYNTEDLRSLAAQLIPLMKGQVDILSLPPGIVPDTVVDEEETHGASVTEAEFEEVE
jgi:hypothetical protein